MAEPDPSYFLDHYGTCAAGPQGCVCLKPAARWLGRACPNWNPLGVRSHAELQAYVCPKDEHPRDTRAG